MKTKNLFTLFTLFALFGTLFTSCVYNPNTKERIEENLEETLIEEKIECGIVSMANLITTNIVIIANTLMLYIMMLKI